jgi:AsmA protein
MTKRTVVIALIALVVVVVIAGFIVAGRVDSYRPRVQAELQSKLNRPVTLGHLGLKLFPLSIRVDGLTIGEAPQFSTGRPFATANQVFVSASIFSLIRGNPEVKDLVLDKPQIELVRNPAGVWNYSSLGSSSSGSNSGASAGSSGSPSSPSAGSSGSSTSAPKGAQNGFSLAKLEIDDGQLGYTDRMTSQPRAVYDHIDLKLTDFAPGKEFGLELGVHFPGEGNQLFAFKGKAGPFGQGQNAGLPPVNGHLTLDQVSLAAVNRFSAGALPPHTDTVASGKADIDSSGNTLACKGDLKLENTIIHGSKIDYPIEANYDLSEDRKQEKIQIRSTVLKLGPTTLNASGDVDAGAKPMRLNVKLTTKDSSITEIAKLAGALGVAFNPAYQVKGTLSMDVTAKGPANQPQLNGSIIGKQLEASGGEIKQPVSVPEIDLTLSPDTILSNTFTAKSGSTALSAAFALSQYTTKNMNVDATVKTDGANLAEVLNIAKAYGVDAVKGVSGTGNISLDAHMKGPLADSSKLLYSGTGSLANASITSSSLIKGQNIALTNVNTKCQLNGGVITLSPVSANIFGGSANGTVTADMRPATPQCALKLKLGGVDTNALLSAVSSMKNTLYGSLAADSDLRFALASSNDLTRTLNGTLNFDVTNGQLKNINILSEISKVGKFLNSAPAQASGSGTALRKLAGTLNIVNGVANTNNLTAVLDTGSLSANGALNLVNQDVNMHMTAVLASGVSQSVGGSKVGGYLNTALANNKGELVLPVIISGNMAHPLFAPDVQAMAKMRLSNLLPTSGDPSKATSGLLNSVLGNKGDAVGGILGGVLGGQKPQQGQQQQQQQQSPLNSLFDQLKKKKKK